jgi:hypothetical protein
MKEWLASLPPIPIYQQLLVILLLALLTFLVYLSWKAWKRLNGLELKDRFAARNEFIKTTAQILGGAFFLFGLYFTWQNLIETQSKNSADLSIALDKQTTELYVKAIEQLGSDKLEVRLGGIYALERIARTSEKDHWPIMEVLTAYVRENAPWPPEELAVARKKRQWAKPKDKVILPILQLPWNAKTEETKTVVEPDPDIQAVLAVLGRTAIPFAQKGEERQLDLRATNLAGSDLVKTNLQNAALFDANLYKAKLWGANLQGAQLWNTILQEATLIDANLQSADLDRADLNWATFFGANLPGGETIGSKPRVGYPQ